MCSGTPPVASQVPDIPSRWPRPIPLRQTGAGSPARSFISDKELAERECPFGIVKSRPFGLKLRPDPRRNKDTGHGRCARLNSTPQQIRHAHLRLAPDGLLPVTWLPHPPIKTD